MCLFFMSVSVSEWGNVNKRTRPSQHVTVELVKLGAYVPN